MPRDADLVAQLFSVLHDGTITDVERTERGLRLRVDIEYLAERIRPGFEHVAVELEGVGDLEFEHWTREADGSGAASSDSIDGNLMGLEIGSAESEDDVVSVACVGDSAARPGGTLRFRTEQCSVFDPDGAPVSMDRLIELAREYWSDR